MRALIQRVTQASVSVDGRVVSNIDRGFVVFLGVSKDDTEGIAHHLVDKIVNLRVFDDDNGRFNYSALDVSAELLVVSQFTLYADTRKGRRPSFVGAAQPQKARDIFDQTVSFFKETGLEVATGIFQSYMSVSIENDGPVTIMLDSEEKYRSKPV